jgi:hypothetical protein
VVARAADHSRPLPAENARKGQGLEFAPIRHSLRILAQSRESIQSIRPSRDPGIRAVLRPPSARRSNPSYLKTRPVRPERCRASPEFFGLCTQAFWIQGLEVQCKWPKSNAASKARKSLGRLLRSCLRTHAPDVGNSRHSIFSIPYRLASSRIGARKRVPHSEKFRPVGVAWVKARKGGETPAEDALDCCGEPAR